MKFLIQKINGKIVHDFSFTLLQSIEFQRWLTQNKDGEKIIVKYFDTVPDAIEFKFKQIHNKYVPVGSVEFVSAFLQHFYGKTPKPRNVPEELWNHPSYHSSYDFAKRHIFNGTEKDFKGRMFIKSNEKIKGTCGIFNEKEPINLPAGEYQFSDVLTVIESEWRAFVYDGKLVGLQNYAGDFTKFPNVTIIKEMIKAYKSAPIAYTLDVGIGEDKYDDKYGMYLYSETFVIEVHDFFSCGLYGFADLSIYPYMLHRWFYQYLQINMVKEYGKNFKTE
jgi:hypothetical protein